MNDEPIMISGMSPPSVNTEVLHKLWAQIYATEYRAWRGANLAREGASMHAREAANAAVSDFSVRWLGEILGNEAKP